VSDLPTTRYAKTADGVHIAYQVWGEGPDLVMVPGFISHLEVAWDSPGYAEMNRRLGQFARVISFDKRGTGLSDRDGPLPDADRRMLDVGAVMDAVGSAQAAIFGVSEGGAMSTLFAASRPDRVTSLVLYGSYANPVKGVGHPIGAEPEKLQEMADLIEERWGDGVALSAWAPSLGNDEGARAWWAQTQRLAASPGAAAQLVASYNLIDIRPALPLVQAPTLVLHRTDDRMVPVVLGRELAEGIPDSRMVEFPGSDHLLPTTNWREIIDELEEFVTGDAPAPGSDRFLATVLFTDIVSSTDELTRLGDERWREVMNEHDRLVQHEVHRFGGRVIHGTGDGVLAIFDGPTRAIHAARAVSTRAGELGIRIRAGVHTGEILERVGDVTGLAVHIAARVADKADAGEIFVSRTTTELVSGSGLQFEPRGEFTLKGVDGTWPLLALDAS
jgi:class 3 adenylate cyclase/alpha-beta hydrolase superfamily lysophospholipase